MAILKAKKTRELNEKEIQEKLKEMYIELSKEKATSEIGGSVKNPGRIRELRRAIARIKTEQGRRASNVKPVKSTTTTATKVAAKRSTSGASDGREVVK